jgi:hypothetical protein
MGAVKGSALHIKGKNARADLTLYSEDAKWSNCQGFSFNPGYSLGLRDLQRDQGRAA